MLISHAHIKVIEISSDYNPSILTDVQAIVCDTTTNPIYITISTEDIQNTLANAYRGFKIYDKYGNANSNNIIITLETGGTINGLSSFVLNNDFESCNLISDGVNMFTQIVGIPDTIPLKIPFICTTTEFVNNAVYVSGDGLVQRASNNNISFSKVVGFISSKPTTTSCVVQMNGTLGGFTSLTPGSRYFLATNGAISLLPPTNTNSVICSVGIASSPTTLIISLDSNLTIRS